MFHQLLLSDRRMTICSDGVPRKLRMMNKTKYSCTTVESRQDMDAVAPKNVTGMNDKRKRE